MQYNKVFIDSFAYELPSLVVSTREIEERLSAVYRKLYIPIGQLETITGIKERRWWPNDFSVSIGATIAAEKALQQVNMKPQDIDCLIYAGVCRDYIEPATACRVAAELGITESAAVYDVSNACLGVLNGIVDIANRIELGQIRTGMVVTCESSRDVNEDVIYRLNDNPNIEHFKNSLATLTGGSGAAAVILSDGSFNPEKHRHQLVGGVNKCAVEHHELCRWGLRKLQNTMFEQFLITDAVSVLKYGLSLGLKTWTSFLLELGWARELVDKVISHQVGKPHRTSILQTLGINEDKDFPTFSFLGNMGTASLPISAALAGERDFIVKGDQVGLLGIGSGLNCLMMGLKW